MKVSIFTHKMNVVINSDALSDTDIGYDKRLHSSDVTCV